MARFFIDRPVFAWVIAIGIMMAGLLALRNMAVAQYPAIAPPAVSVNVTFPGASAETVQTTVVQVIEQQLSGIDNLLYFDSQTTNASGAKRSWSHELVSVFLALRILTGYQSVAFEVVPTAPASHPSGAHIEVIHHHRQQDASEQG